MKRLQRNAPCFLFLMAALIVPSSSVRAASFNFLYIEASEGNSSGGHAALQFGDEVYHFQRLDSGLIRLFRQERDNFHFLYRFLQNRPIHESRIVVSDDTFQLLQKHFTWQFLAQERQFKLLDELKRDRIFIRHCLRRLGGGMVKPGIDDPTGLQLLGAGLFFSDQDELRTLNNNLSKQHSLAIKKLRQKVEQRYGPDFLLRKMKHIEPKIKSLTPTRWPVLNPKLPGTQILPLSYSFTDRYLDFQTALLAIKVLDEARPLQTRAYFLMTRQEFMLTIAERQALLDLRRNLEAGFLESIDSVRPDWGYAALVNMARYLAVDSSLQNGYWVFLDDHDQNSEWISPDEYLPHNPQIKVLLNEAHEEMNQLRQSASHTRHLSEREYSHLEMLANRYFELLKSQSHLGFRFNGARTLPMKSIGIANTVPPNLSREQLITALANLDHFENSLLQQLRQGNRYDLLSKNCVTELFKSINQALLTSRRAEQGKPENRDAWLIRESRNRLGGYVGFPDDVIPFVSYQSVLSQYHVSNYQKQDSYRGQELAKLEARHNKLITAIIESNIVSSRLYQYNPDDALFVFFTDHHVLLRPLFGMFNTAAGFGQSLYGAFSWPFDSGKNLKAGATGILMSVPELLFFNLRKGSYKYLSSNRLANEEQSGF